LRRRKDAVQLELKKPGIAANKGPGVARAACCWSGAVSSRAGQCGRILGVLIAARGAWVPLPRIIECAAQYNARIFELRRLGFHITNRTREIDGQRHSWFRIEPTETIVSRCQHENAAPAATRCSFPEFGALGKEAGYPDWNGQAFSSTPAIGCKTLRCVPVALAPADCGPTCFAICTRERPMGTWRFQPCRRMEARISFDPSFHRSLHVWLVVPQRM